MNEKVYGANYLKKSRNIGIVALISIIAAVVLLILGDWRWSIVTFLPGVAGIFLALAYREDKESRSNWLFAICFVFEIAFAIALLVQLGT